MDPNTQLLLRAKTGDGEAFAELYGSLCLAVVDYVRSIDGQFCPHEHEDIVQETWVRTWRSAPKYRGLASAKTYIFSIARNVLRERVRQRRKRLAVVAALRERTAADLCADRSPIAAAETKERLSDAIRKMPLQQREAIRLVLMEQLTPAEAASRVGCSPNAMYKRIRKAAKWINAAM